MDTPGSIAPRIIGMIRLKNEEEWITQVLDKASPLVDGFVILDDGSTDKTPDLCRSHPKVLRYQYQDEPLTDEARDKNKLLQLTLNERPDWILALDGDEFLEDIAPHVIRREISLCPSTVTRLGLDFLYMWDSHDRYRADGIYANLRHPRLFRVRGAGVEPETLSFQSTRHGANFHCGSVPSNLPGDIRYIDVKVKHYGYFERSLREQKRAFYEQKDPEKAAAGYYRHLTDETGMVLHPWAERSAAEVIYSDSDAQAELRELKKAGNPLWHIGLFLLPGSRSHLDIGSNTGVSLQGLPPAQITCIEKYPPAAKQLRERPFRVLEGDAGEIAQRLFQEQERFDRITLFDFIEHISKAEGEKLLETIEKMAMREVLLFVPLETDEIVASREYQSFMARIFSTIPQEQHSLQQHRSRWTPDDFRSRGYRVVLLDNFHMKGFGAFFAIKYLPLTEKELAVARINRALAPPNARPAQAATDGTSEAVMEKQPDSRKSEFGRLGVNSKIENPWLITNPDRIFIGNHVLIRSGARLEAIKEYRGTNYDPTLIIEDGAGIELSVHIGAANHVHIGKNAMIAGRVTILDHDHEYKDPVLPPLHQPLQVGKIDIGEDAWIGENVCICKNVVIGKHAVIGANSVVKRDIPPFCVAAGNPAQIIKVYDYAANAWQPVSGKTLPEILAKRNQCLESLYAQALDRCANGKPAEAIGLLKRLVHFDPGHALGHNDLGVLLIQQGDARQAREHYEKAVRLQPENVTFIKNLADLYTTVEPRIGEALALYQKVLSLQPEDVEATLALGHIYSAMSRADDARRLFERVLALDPDNKQAEEGLALIRQQGPSAKGQEPPCADYPKEVIPASSPAPLVSIVIPVFNKVSYTQKCLEAVRKNTASGTYEIIIVDNASSDGTGAYLASRPDIRVMTNSKNVGFTAACNQGAKTARGEYVLFLNNDTEPQPNWLDSMIELMESDPTIGVTGSKLVYPDGRLQEAGGIIFNDGSGWNYGRSGEASDPAFNFVREVDYVSGASLLIRHSLLKKLNYFDERYAPGYYEDTDLCFAARARGNKVVYCPFSAVIHHEGASSGNDLSQGMKRYQVINKQKFTDKWAADLSKQHAPSIDHVVAASERDTKGNILVIDPLLPLFDRAAGSLRLFTILRLLRAKGYHVTYIARDGRGQERYAHILQKAGIEIYATDPEMLAGLGQTVQARKIDLPRILSARPYQLAFLSFYPIALQYCDPLRLASPRTRIIVDSVDIHFVRERRQAELAHDARALRNAEVTKKNELASYAKADAVVTVTEQDWDHIKEFLPDKPHFLLPTIHPVNERPPDLNGRKGLLFVGNFNHTPNLDAVLYCAKEILPIVRKTLPDLTLTVVGNNPPKEILALQSANISVTGYVPSVAPYLERARVSIAPLRYGAGMKGKIGEAMAHGLPVVTTKIGAEGMGLVSGETALIGDTPAELAEQIITLCTHDEAWKALASAGRQFILDHYSPEKVGIQLEEILRQAAALCPPEAAGKKQAGLPANGQEGKKGLVSIVILTCNELKYTKKCVESIEKHTPESHEILFVDNGSEDGTPAWLRKRGQEKPHYRLIENKENLGFAKGCNQGIKAAKGEYILLLNNDVIVTEGWLAGMWECLHAHPGAGIVGPMTNQISGIQKVEEVGYASLEGLDEYAREFRRKNRHRRVSTPRIVGFCMLFRRELADQIGLLDETFGTGNFEDDDFCLRAELAGFRNAIAGDVFIHHFGSRTFIGRGIEYRDAMARNERIFLQKWSHSTPQTPEEKKYLALRAREAAKRDSDSDQYQKAVDRLLAVIKLGTEGEEGHFALAELLLEGKQYEKAAEILKALPAASTDDRKSALLGYCQEGMSRIEEADPLASQALSLNPKNALALNLKGILAHRRQNADEAAGYFQKAIAADGGYGEPHTNLGVIQWEAGRKEEALDLFEKGFILSPTAAENAQLYHSAIAEIGDFLRGERLFREAKALHRFHKRIRFLLIDLLLKQKKYDRAIEEITEAMIHFGVEDGMLQAAIRVRKEIGPQEKCSHGPETGISLCMIVKNEEKHLPKCLQNAKPIVDEMIVVDTGSADRTKDIAVAFGAKVFDFPWDDDFSAPRNFSLSKAKGDWVIVLDADEVISPEDHRPLLALTRKGSRKAAYSMTTRNYTDNLDILNWTANGGNYREEAGSGWFPSEKVRIFPRNHKIRFENPVHEFVEPSLERNHIPIEKCNIPVHHYGKLNADKEQKKGERYFSLGKKKLQEKGPDIHSLKELAVQANIVGRNQEAIELWNQVLKLSPDMTEAYINLTAIYMKLEKYQEASVYSRKALDLDPDCKEAMLNHAIVEFTLGNIKNVIAALEGNGSTFAEHPIALSLLSVAYILMGEKEKGLRLVKKIKAMGFNDKEYYQNTAKKLIAMGRNQEGRLLFDIIGEMDFDAGKRDDSGPVAGFHNERKEAGRFLEKGN